MKLALFGTAGIPDEYDAKSGLFMPRWLKEYGLDAYEYQCGRGVNISEATARKLGELARREGIALSVHSPYYICLSSEKEEVRESSIGHIIKSARAADAMGAQRVVVHSGACSGKSRGEALALAMDTLTRALAALDEQNLSHIRLCPETMGKVNHLGSPEEVAVLCALDERLIPTIDFGHINARAKGALKSKADVLRVFEEFERVLGRDRMKRFHSHFSKIEYSAGGEKRHLTLDDKEYGPEFEPIAEAVCQRGYEPVFICESAGTQAKDAKRMKDIYETIKKGGCEA